MGAFSLIHYFLVWYNAVMGTHHQKHDRLEYLRTLTVLKESDRVVDIGCGFGWWYPHVKDSVREYIGIDVDEQRIQEAKTQYSTDLFECCSVEAFSAEHVGEFDVAFALDVSEHIPDHQWKEILLSVRKMLKPNGKLYLHTPNGDFFLERLKASGVLPQVPGHIAVRGARHNVKLLQQAGYQVQCFSVPHYRKLFSWLHHFRFFPAGLFKARSFFLCYP